MSTVEPETIPPSPGFPDNIIDVLMNRLKVAMPDHERLRRPLRYTDPARSVGVFAHNWVPDQEDSMQIGQNEPALAVYHLRVQNMIQAADEQEGRALYTVDAKIIRAMLYRDPTLPIQFGALSETLFDTIERLQRYGVRNQSFMNNELQGQFVYLATTDLWVETEITKLN